MPCPRFLALLALAALVAAPAWSQTERIGSQTRVLFTSTDTIKDNAGVYRQITTTLTYEPVRGAYVQPVTAASGALLRSDARPGGRCALYDVWETVDGSLERIRFVIVDLRNVRVLDADADPQADTNLANPAARRQSRL